MTVKILQGHCLDVLKTMPDESVYCCVTSPPIETYRKRLKCISRKGISCLPRRPPWSVCSRVFPTPASLIA
jgi:hypothetical protein